MPVTPGTPPVFARLWAFVDQFSAGETADREDFDTILGDFETSLNDIIDYFDGANTDATDQRYLGLSASTPALRTDGSALQNGDTFISTNIADLGTFYFYSSATWVALATVPFSVYFLTLIGAADAATLRGLLGLGSAAVSAASAFATAAQGAKADSALQVPGLLANNVTDWDTVSTTKTGFYQSDTGSTNSPYSGDSFSAIYIARTATSGALILYGNTSNRIFIRQFNTTWGFWREFNMRATGTSTDLDNMGVGVLAARFTDTATGAPSGFGTYTGLVEHYGSDTVRRQIVTIDGKALILLREHNGTSWGSWTAFSPSIGYGQSWQDVAGSRAANTTYQNTTGRPIQISVQPNALAAGRNLQASTDGSTWVTVQSSGSVELYFQTAVIPAGQYYRFTGGFAAWKELR